MASTDTMKPMGRRALVLHLAVSILAVACAPTGIAPTPGPTDSSAASPATTDTPIAATSPKASPAPSIHGDTLTMDALVSYDGFRVWAEMSAGIALVEVADVGPVRWSTVSGLRPDESLLHSAPKGHEDTPGIGRFIDVSRIRLIDGQWLGEGDLARYWRVGGKIGADEMIHSLDLPTFSSGDKALAFLLPEPVNLAVDGDLPLQVGWLFPVDANGSVITLDPNERITVQDLELLVP